MTGDMGMMKSRNSRNVREMNKRNVHVLLIALMVMLMAVFSQAAELTLDSRREISGELRDGTKIATGRIVCRDAHTGFHIWMNVCEDEGRPGHCLIQGKHDNRHEIRVRIEGVGWLGAQEWKRGMVKNGTGEQAMFDVVSDGRQHVASDEYVYSITGNCTNNG